MNVRTKLRGCQGDDTMTVICIVKSSHNPSVTFANATCSLANVSVLSR
jgi:hypothetical protein